MSINVTEAAAELVQELDGTYGRTWEQVALNLDELADDEGRTYASPASLAKLIRALLACGALQ